MKGHMEDGKFHPHTEHKKGVRKSRDQYAKTQGIRLSRELKTLTESERKELFNKVNSIGVSVSKKQRKIIYNKLWEDNVKRAKNRLKGKEKFWLKTNINMETFAFALNEDTGGIRTLAFIGHENKDNPEDVRRIPDVKLKNERKARDQSTRTEGIKHIQLIKNELNDNLIKMKNNPDNLNITKERTNLQKQLKQLRKKYNYYDDQS